MKYFSFSWNEGRFFDWWTVVHFLSGAVIGFVGEVLLFSFKDTFLIGFVLVVLWEVFEHMRGIRETLLNRVVDVVIAVIGMGLFFILSFAFRDWTLVMGSVIILLTIFLSYRGWRAYLIRTGKNPPHTAKEAYENIKEDISKKKDDVV